MKRHIDIKVFITSNVCDRFIKSCGKTLDITDFKLIEINQHKIKQNTMRIVMCPKLTSIDTEKSAMYNQCMKRCQN